MSIEKTLLTTSKQYMMSSNFKNGIELEVTKGCCSELSAKPVALEPLYQPVFNTEEIVAKDKSNFGVLEIPAPENELVRLQMWISPKQECEWNRSELMLKQLSYVRHRIALEIIGNKKKIAIQILCHKDDISVVRAAFSGQFEQCKLFPAKVPMMQNASSELLGQAVFCDFYPLPPYSHLLTSPDELQRSPYIPLVTTLSQFPKSATGFYQVVFAPVSPQNNWHRNVEYLTDVEHDIKLSKGVSNLYHYPQEPPSATRQAMSQDVEIKSHNDKPFFAAALRIGVINGQENAKSLLRALSIFGSLIQNGGRPLGIVSSEDYRQNLSPEKIAQMLKSGLTYRPGFLINSRELTSMVHIPSTENTEHIKSTLKPLETLLPPDDDSLSQGTPIGFCEYGDDQKSVCIPDYARSVHTHVIGGSGSGKTSLLEVMSLYDIQRGHGVAILDPHGTMIWRLLGLIPAEYHDRIIYLNPGDPDWVPIWNPLDKSSGLPIDRLADELVGSFKSFVSGWGDRMERLMRQSFLAALHLPGGCLYDVFNLLRHKSDESKNLRDNALKLIDNDLLKLFWQNDIDRYSSADLSPPKNKLGKLLDAGTIALMLSQSDSSFHLHEVMEKGKIVLIDLSCPGPEIQSVLGCFMLSLFQINAMSRKNKNPRYLKPFHIYCDEAHRFVTDAIENLIAETRKFGVSLTLSHQFLSQFKIKKTDALSSVGSTIIYNVNSEDAQHLKKNLYGKVDADEIVQLDKWHAIARIGNKVTRIATNFINKEPDDALRNKVIENSHKLYYKPVDEVKRLVHNRSKKWKDSSAGIESLTDILNSDSGQSNPAEGSLSSEEFSDYDRY